MTIVAKTTKFLLIAAALSMGLAVSQTAKAETQGHAAGAGGHAANWHGGSGHGRRAHGAGGWHGNNGMSLGLGIPRRPAA